MKLQQNNGTKRRKLFHLILATGSQTTATPSTGCCRLLRSQSSSLADAETVPTSLLINSTPPDFISSLK